MRGLARRRDGSADAVAWSVRNRYVAGVAAGRNRERFVSFTQRILLSMLAGIVVGVALNWAGPVVPRLYELLVEGLFYVVGAAFVALLKLMVVPLVLEQVGLPVEGIALIIGVARLLDMLRTAVNVSGDGVVTCVVARSEDALDIEIFSDPKATLNPSLRAAPLKAGSQGS